jgi:hypothetical protein
MISGQGEKLPKCNDYHECNKAVRKLRQIYKQLVNSRGVCGESLQHFADRIGIQPLERHSKDSGSDLAE